jgi:D-3-phosphoglycerate dehydrogenase
VAGLEPFRVAVSPEVRRSDGRLLYELDLLDAEPGLEWELLPDLVHELPPRIAAEYDALLLATSRYVVSTRFAAGGERLALIARLDAGVEAIDIEACTRADILVTSAPDAVRRPMATCAIAFMLALTLRMPQLDRAARGGDWDAGTRQLGIGLTGRTLGLIGLGNVGSEVVRLAHSFDMEFLAYDPYARPPASAEHPPIEMVGIEELLERSDVVCITCQLTPETRRLIDAKRLMLMKPTAYLINIARGPIVDQTALVEVLGARRIAGAALDVFEQEPIDVEDPLLRLDNVIVTPHAIGWTDEFGVLSGRSGSRAILAVARGEAPAFPLNPAVLERHAFVAKLRRYRHAHARRAEA